MTENAGAAGIALHLSLTKDEQGSCAQTLRDQLHALHTPVAELVLDFANCDHLEAEAVDALGSMLDRVADDGATISLQGVSPNVRVILGIAGLLEFADAHSRNGD